MSAAMPVAITGGPGGLVANRESIEHLAGLFTHAAEACAAAVLLVGGEHQRLGPIGGSYGGAGLLDPSGLARARGLLGDALGNLGRGTDGVRTLATRLRAAADGYPWGADALHSGLLDRVEGALAGSWSLNVAAAGAAGIRLPAAGSPGTRVAGLDPRTADLLVDLADPGALSTIMGDQGFAGRAVPTGRAPVSPPRSLSDVVTGLSEVNHTGTGGGIDVRILTRPDGTRRAVVDITGTRSWGYGGRDPADLVTNAGSLVGRPGAYSKGVLDALRRAGVRRTEPVLLVGHSQGGMIATIVAHEAVTTGEFDVTHVVTAGAPISRTAGRLPHSVRVLALENTHDLVPRLDGRPNPDRPNVTTVTAAAGDGSVPASHDIDTSYRPIADAAERAGGRSMRDYLTSARGFFDASSSEQHRFRIERR